MADKKETLVEKAVRKEFERYHDPALREKIEAKFQSFGIVPKVSGKYEWDFNKGAPPSGTQNNFYYLGGPGKVEEINWVFYAGEIPRKNDANVFFILSDYHESGMRHDIFLFYKMGKLKLLIDGSYLYLNEAEANGNALLSSEPLPYPDSGQYAILKITDIMSDIESLVAHIEKHGEEFVLDRPVELERTQQYTQRHFARPFINGQEERPDYEVWRPFAFEIWEKLNQKSEQ